MHDLHGHVLVSATGFGSGNVISTESGDGYGPDHGGHGANGNGSSGDATS